MKDFLWLKKYTIDVQVMDASGKVKDKYDCWLKKIGVDENGDAVFKEYGLENITPEDQAVLDKSAEEVANLARQKIYYLSFEAAKQFYKGSMFLDLYGIHFPDDWGIQSYNIDQDNQVLGLKIHSMEYEPAKNFCLISEFLLRVVGKDKIYHPLDKAGRQFVEVLRTVLKDLELT